MQLRTESLTGTVRDTETFVVTEEPVYTVAVTQTTGFEGDSFDFTVGAFNVIDGEQVYWTLSSDGVVEADDFENGIQGVETVFNNVATFTLTSLFDTDYNLPSGYETFNLLLRTGGYTGTVEASDTFTVYDLDPQYSVSPNKTMISEGESVTFTLQTSNVIDNTIVYWSLFGDTDADDFTSDISNQSLTVNSNSAEFTVFAKADSSDSEMAETFIASVSTDAGISAPVAESIDVTISDTSFLLQNTDVYALFDTTSMFIFDAIDAANALTAWHQDLSSVVDGYEGNLFLIPVSSRQGGFTADPEQYLRHVPAIKDRTIKIMDLDWGTIGSKTVSATYGTWAQFGSGYRIGDFAIGEPYTSWYTETTINSNFVVINFVDEAFTSEVFLYNVPDQANYHGITDPPDFFGSATNETQPTTAYKTDFWEMTAAFNEIVNTNGGFFKGVLYPIPNDGIGDENFVFHAVAAVYGTTLTNSELFGTGGTYDNPSSDGIYTVVSAVDPNWTDMRNLITSNPYNDTNLGTTGGESGLVNYGWRVEPNKTSPASEVFTSETFGDELNDLFTS